MMQNLKPRQKKGNIRNLNTYTQAKKNLKNLKYNTQDKTDTKEHDYDPEEALRKSIQERAASKPKVRRIKKETSKNNKPVSWKE